MKRPLLPAIGQLLVASACFAQTPAPVLTQIRDRGSTLSLEWTTSEPDQAFSVQSRPALNGGIWTLAPGLEPWPVVSTQATVAVEEDAPNRFYRLLSVPKPSRGKLVSVAPLDTYSTVQIRVLFTLGRIPLIPTNSIRTYRVVYETIDPWGAPILASGVLAFPQGLTQALPLVSYQHGTVMEPSDTPSGSLEQRVPGIGFATSGYGCALPDLLGLGASPGFHPYHHARSEATAAIDLLRAARTWCGTNGYALDGRLFLCGYSQGGHATMALHRELETFYQDEFTVTASAPMAGAYDLSGVSFDDFLSGRPLPNPYYIVYLLAAFQDVYRLTNAWTSWLAEPYATALPPLLDRRADGAEINAAITNNARLLFRPEVLAAIESEPDHPLRLALRDNDVYQWFPRAPTLLVHCAGDLDVPFANSEKALTTFQSLGATNVALLDPNATATHGECALDAFLAMKEWFDSFPP